MAAVARPSWWSRVDQGIGEELREGGADMARHSGGRGWYGKVLGAALGVALLAGGASAWSAQAGSVGGTSPDASSSAKPGSDIKPVAETIAHASEKGARGVNITIDDGPDPVWTPQVLDLLREYGVKATFCMVGTQAQAHPDLVKKVVAAGHRLCDHSVSHDTTMDKNSETYQSKQILDAERMITKASGGVRPMYYRAPGGAFTPYSRKLAASRGMRPLGWNVDSKDFERPGTDAIVATVEREVPNGPTLLFHDAGGDRSQTVEALDRILPRLKEQGYSFGFPVC
jgi:peptidoglycan/xylan/chitin deacetylase (PgdA/CDA1 family)